MFWKRLAAWVALPASVLAALTLGHYMFRPKFTVAANEFEELVGITPVPLPDETVFQLIRADGEAAEGAVVVLLEPEISIDYADAEGQVRLHRSLGGPVRLQAYIPGHELVALGPIAADEVTEIQFESRIQPEIPKLNPERLVRHDLQLLSRDGSPVPGVQVIARRSLEEFDSVRPTIEPGAEPSRFLAPWVAFSDEEGWVRIEGLPELSVQLLAYPLGLPRAKAWELDAIELNPRPEGESNWQLAIASLTLSNLPPETAVRIERTDVPGILPLRRVPPSESLSWKVLPPGNYRVTSGDTTHAIELFAGANTVDW
ncbi:MAG: hypothetical protein MK209_06645 [Planctomycetes bacterium]|nr:hypothetical protein [Planctomycetota bacterium]